MYLGEYGCFHGYAMPKGRVIHHHLASFYTTLAVEDSKVGASMAHE